MATDETALVRQTLGFLCHRGEPPATDLEFLQQNWLTPLFYVRLGDRDHPLRGACAAAFNEAFERRGRIDACWADAVKALTDAEVRHLTLGSLPFARSLYPHPAARLSQDIDILVLPEDAGKARLALQSAGFDQPPGHGLMSRDEVQLDLHTTPGEEARTPSLAKAYYQSIQRLFERAVDCPDGPEGARMLCPADLLDNRVIHFFKHYCQKLIFAVELALLFQLEMEREELREAVELSNSGRVWAFVLEVLKGWGLECPLDPTSESDRAFVAQAGVRRVADQVIELRGGRGPLRVAAGMLSTLDRVRYGWELAWPQQDVLRKIYPRERVSLPALFRMRLHRLGRAIYGAWRGR